eukprot:gene6242-2862_t
MVAVAEAIANQGAQGEPPPERVPEAGESTSISHLEQEQEQGPAQSAPRHTGTVKWFNATKGYGFVTPEGGGDELFVHQSNIRSSGFRSLREGEVVEFDVEPGTDGRSKAINVSGPEGSAPQGAPPRSSMKGGFTQNPRGRMPMGGGRGGPGVVAMGGRGMDQGGPGRGFYGYPMAGPMPAMGGVGPGMGGPMMPPIAYVGYYFPPGGEFQDPGRGGRGRGIMPGGRMGGHAMNPMMYPPMQHMQMQQMQQHQMQMQPQQQLTEPSGLQVVVHNLPWSCTWQQLKDLFHEWKVERAEILDDHWGRSRGFGTVRLSSAEEAAIACDRLNNTTFEGRVISVRIDRFA